MSMPTQLNVRTFVAPGFAENGYIAWRDGSASAICIDPGNTAAAMLELLAAEGLKLEAILLTHAHLDHVEGVAPLVRATNAPVYLHPADRFLYDNAARQAQQFGMQLDPPPPPDHELAHGQQLELAGVLLHVRHVPGHSPGHVLFHVPDAGLAFVGDIVFQGSIGRTDLPGGDLEQLITGIRAQVLSLPDETTLLTGHGPATTPGHEGATNPFLVPHFGGGLA
jgi:hydroxyacylglutathione hydrolase